MSIATTVPSYITPVVHSSKWGYHPCDYATLLSIKQYHRLLYRAYCEYKRLVAWTNKTVYQTGTRPPVADPVTTIGQDGAVSFARHGHPYHGENLYLHVLHQYRQARRPRAEGTDVAPLDLPYGWKDQLTELHRVYESRRV